LGVKGEKDGKNEERSKPWKVSFPFEKRVERTRERQEKSLTLHAVNGGGKGAILRESDEASEMRDEQGRSSKSQGRGEGSTEVAT